MCAFNLLLIGWIVALACTAVYAVRRRWRAMRWWATASVLISLAVAVTKPA